MQLGGTPPQLFDQAKDGVADIVWTLPTYQAGRFTKSEVFELPFLTHTPRAPPARRCGTYVQKNALDEFKGVKPIFMHMHDGATASTSARPRAEDAGGAQGPEDPRGHPHRLAR
jgi:hypothetical protein